MADLPLPSGTKTIVVDDPRTPFDGVTTAEIEAEQKWWKDVKRYLALKGYTPESVEYVAPTQGPPCPPAVPDRVESGLIHIDLDSDVVVGFGRDDDPRIPEPNLGVTKNPDGTVCVRMTAAQFRELMAGRQFVVGEDGRGAELIDEPTVVEAKREAE
jgi:hypothetical protein